MNKLHTAVISFPCTADTLNSPFQAYNPYFRLLFIAIYFNNPISLPNLNCLTIECNIFSDVTEDQLDTNVTLDSCASNILLHKTKK